MNTPILNYIIIEDKRIDELHLLYVLSKFQSLNFIKTARNTTDATDSIIELKPDLVFVDVEIPGSNDLDFIKKLRYKIPILVFITAHPEFALESFELNALDYLLKPLTEKRFQLTYERIMEYWSFRQLAMSELLKTETNVIIIKDGYKKIVLSLGDILYLEAMQDYTKVVTRSKKYMVNATLGRFLNMQAEHIFIRIHRSYAIVIKNIRELHSDKVIGTGFELPIGKTYRQHIARLKI
jgi:DNA-binding LytR/AlgR family response regulator